MRHFKIINSTIKKSFTLKSFTLLEMLIVIGIIGVLVAMTTVSYSTSQRKARDAKRKQDLKAIQNALEQYYAVCGYQYPTPSNSKFSSIICLSPSIAIMSTVPVDPKTITPYPCNNCTSSQYTICASTENEPTPCLSNQQ